MPPKKAQAAKAAEKKKAAAENKDLPSRNKEEKETEPKDEEMPDAEEKATKSDDADSDSKAQAGSKRKSPPTEPTQSKPPKKEPRQGSRASTRGGTGKDANQKQLLNFLLSSDAIEYCYPKDELDAARSGKFKKCYSLTPPSLFTPFEHLITAHLLSKPLSHTLGMRSTRTLLNAPYSFATPSTIKEAGEDKVWHALEDAKTQHRQKTAAQIHEMAVEYAPPQGTSGDSDVMLELATQANEGGPKATIAHVKNTVKGMGEVGGQIFCRRVQACDGWGEAIWPYADPRSLDALREVGIKARDADELQSMIESDVDWDKVGDMGLINEKKGHDEQDYEMRVAVEFVTVLERAIGVVLEGRVGELKKKAAEWA